MSDQGGPDAGRWPLPTWRRITDFFLTIGQLERSYQSLKADNEKLNKRVAELAATISDHTGQLKILMNFVQASLDREVEAKAEQAAARYFERLMTRRSEPPEDDR